MILETKKEKLSLEVQGVKFFKQFVIVKFKGIDNINDIEQYKGCSLFVSREDAVALEEDEYFIADPIGWKFTRMRTGGTFRDIKRCDRNRGE